MPKQIKSYTNLVLVILFFVILTLTSHIEGSNMQPLTNAKSNTINWSLGRIDFIIPEQFELSGRSQNIYYVDVRTKSLKGSNLKEILNNKISQIKDNNGTDKNEVLEVIEIEPNFHAIFYKQALSTPNIVKLEAIKFIEKNTLEMSFEGKAGKEKDMLRGISIIANSYSSETPYGFNVGAGSITSTPGLNEYTNAKFINKINDININISTNVATEILNNHPLQDIDDEIKGLSKEGISLKVITNNEKTVAGFEGHEALVTLNNNSQEPQFRYTWFTAGAKADSFKPEILIKAYGPLKNIEEFKDDWNHLLNSLVIRNEK